MPGRSSKPTRPRDLNELAAAVVRAATEGEEWPEEFEGKNPAAVMLGRLGGKKGGKARAEKLSPQRRREIAQKAAQTRWAAKANSE